MKETLPKTLFETVHNFPDKTALEYKLNGVYKPITYKQFNIDIKLFSKGLWSLGVRAGDTVALIAENGPRWVTADWAIICLGGITTPIFPTLTVEQLAYILKDANIKLAIVGDPKLAAKMESAIQIVGKSIPMVILTSGYGEAVPYEALMEMGNVADYSDSEWLRRIEETKPSEPVTIIYTSGTTGEPKGVVLNHVNFISNLSDIVASLPITSEDKFLSFLPLNHIYGRVGDHFLPASLGATVAYSEVTTLKKDITTAKPTLILAVPRVHESIRKGILSEGAKASGIKKILFDWAVRVANDRGSTLGEGKTPSFLNNLQHKITDKVVGTKVRANFGDSLRFLVASGAALPKEIPEFLMGFGIMTVEVFGLTECCLLTLNHPKAYRFGTVGKPLSSVEVKIAKENESDDQGEILVRGKNIMRGYYNKPEATGEAIDEQGWFHTGDIGKFVEGGFLRITDRKKELLILSNGKNVAPQPIENLLKSSDLIDEAVVFGDGQSMISALIVPNFEMLGKLLNTPTTKQEEQIINPKARELVKAELDKLNKSLAEYERVKRYELISEKFTVENDMLTPTMKLKRRIIKQNYSDIIKKMSGGD